MHAELIINELARNKFAFQGLLSGIDKEAYKWKQGPDKWCLLEIICHLYDEEREDFRARVLSVLRNPENPLTPFDPLVWVKERNYLGQNYDEVLNKFIEEREESVRLLRSLKKPSWGNAYEHPKLGKMTALLFLTNWLAHDYLHIRQINRLKYDFLKDGSDVPLNYAGNW